MAAAVTQLQWFGASATEPAGVNAEDTAGIVFNREDSKAGNSVPAALPIPLVAGTVYSWPKQVALVVTAAGTTNIANRRISPASVLPTGLHWYVKGQAYAQSASLGADASTDNTA